MTTTRQEVADVLKRAIKSELDGFKFYDLLSKKVTNADAKRKLENLRDDETRHEKLLIDIFHRHIGGEIGPLPKEGLTPLAEVFHRGQLEERKSEMEFINLAIEAELAATKFYQQERDLLDDPKERGIFDQLAEEEHSHYELLMAEREALSGNYYWFSYNDSSPMEY
ncbi:MAG: ferritin family protein [Candidatus Zixiibacteriota bacterium]